MFAFIKNRIKEVYACMKQGHNYVIIEKKEYPLGIGLSFVPIKINVLVCQYCGIKKEVRA
jgi:hypothetical protein